VIAIWRTATWILLAALTGALLAYPKHLTLEYAPIESLRVFDNLPLFGGLYCGWILVLLLLVFCQRPGRAGPYQGLLLVGAFALVYRGMWDMLWPDWWADGLANITTAKAIQSAGELTFNNPNITYLDFPGLHISTVSISELTGMGIFSTAAVVLILIDVALAGVYYLIALRLLDDVRLAAFASLLGMQGNVVFAALFFYPGFLALVFLGLFTLLLLRSEGGYPERASDRVVTLLLLGAATVTHFVASTLFFSFLAGTYLVRIVGSRAPRALTPSTALLYGVVPTTWLAYWTVQTFDNIVKMGTQLSQNLASDRFLGWFVTGSQANVGGEVPLWAAATKLFWLILLFGLGTLSALFYLFRRRGAGSVEQSALGALVGIMAASAIATLVSTGGFEYFRYLMYAPCVTVPFLLKFVKGFPARVAGYSLAALVVLFAGLSLPTFFAHHPRVEQYAYYPSEYAAGRFLRSSYQDREPRSTILGLGLSLTPIVYYLPDATYVSEGQAAIDLTNEEGLWASIQKMTKVFADDTSGDDTNLFVLSRRPQVYYRHNFGIPETDLKWRELVQELSSHSLIYDNGSIQTYASTAATARQDELGFGLPAAAIRHER